MAEKGLQARIDELEKEIARKDDEHARKIEDLHNDLAAGKKVNREIPGEVTLQVEDQDGGKEKVKVKIKDGHPFVRLNATEVVSTVALMKVATGKSLSEEEAAANKPLVKAGKKGVLTFLETNFAKGAGWLTKLGAILLLFFFLTPEMDAQIRSGRFQNYGPDTLTNADTITWLFPKNIIDLDVYDYTWQIDIDSISGTTAGTIYIQETMTTTGDDNWINVDTIIISTTESIFVAGTVQGIRQRAIIYSTGTQSTHVQAWTRYRRRLF